MTAPHLAVVESSTARANEEDLLTRVRRLQIETRNATQAHVAQLVEALETVGRLADEIAMGGEAYPVTVRDTARRVGQEAPVAVRVLRGSLERR